MSNPVLFGSFERVFLFVFLFVLGEGRVVYWVTCRLAVPKWSFNFQCSFFSVAAQGSEASSQESYGRLFE